MSIDPPPAAARCVHIITRPSQWGGAAAIKYHVQSHIPPETRRRTTLDTTFYPDI